MRPRRLLSGFTLVELLVVIAIVSTLAGLLLPVLGSTRERMQRQKCRNDMRQFIIAAHLYGIDHRDKLPSGASETASNPVDQHIPMMARGVRDTLLRYTGGKQVLSCPNWRAYFKNREDWHYPVYGFVLGYNYLGGRFGTPWTKGPREPNWLSPQTLSDDGSQLLVTDPNNWSFGFARSFVPHTRHGFRYFGDPIDDSQLDFTQADVPTPKALGAQGGNIGRVDGSVEWRPIRQMQEYRGSGGWEGTGCRAYW